MPYHQLTIPERELLAKMHFAGHSLREIARTLQRSPSTLSRELRRHRAPSGTYSAHIAQRRAEHRRRSAKSPAKLLHAPLREYVLGRLREFWSPEQIAGRLPRDYPHDPAMRLSHETLYRWIAENRRQGGQVHRYLRQASRKRRKRYGSAARGVRLSQRTPLSLRPASVNARRRFGHWESDTVEGGKGTGFVVTHVERKSGYVVVAGLPDKRAPTLNAHTLTAFAHLPPGAVRSLTCDNGGEFAGHEELERSLGCRVYFADPYAAWQRGQNENTNGLLRQYFPKGRDFRTLSASEIARAAMDLNHRPRKKHQFRTPHELLEKFLVALQN